jgi:hypothetical protein
MRNSLDTGAAARPTLTTNTTKSPVMFAMLCWHAGDGVLQSVCRPYAILQAHIQAHTPEAPFVLMSASWLCHLGMGHWIGIVLFPSSF